MANYYQKEFETMPVEQIKELQKERLIKTVNHVYKNVPYYADMMDKAGVKPEDIKEAQLLIRRHISKLYGDETAMDLPILYGGSVNPSTAPGYLNIPGIDGLLVGNASLIADSFCAIVESAKGKYNER